jgi:MYXO-CTERM domain-containing protein
MDGTTALHLLCTGGGTNGGTDGGGSRSTGIADSGGTGGTAAGGDAGIAGTGALGSTGWAAGASGMAGAAGATGVEGAKASGAAGSAATPKASADDGQGGGCSVRADRSSERGNVLALGLMAVGILFRRRRRGSHRA